MINSDTDVGDRLKLVFLPNYRVSAMEKICPGADLSEQISTAGKEASGTGNMKFMMNGAITIGTMDGANVEIVEKAGINNEIIFGLSAEEVTKLYATNGYKPREIYDKDQRLKDVFSFIRKLYPNPQYFDYILNALLNSDSFFVLKDFDAYVKAHERANEAYKNREQWLSMSIANIAHSGFFTSDRTINQYNKDLWKLKKISF